MSSCMIEIHTNIIVSCTQAWGWREIRTRNVPRVWSSFVTPFYCHAATSSVWSVFRRWEQLNPISRVNESCHVGMRPSRVNESCHVWMGHVMSHFAALQPSVLHGIFFAFFSCNILFAIFFLKKNMILFSDMTHPWHDSWRNSSTFVKRLYVQRMQSSTYVQILQSFTVFSPSINESRHACSENAIFNVCSDIAVFYSLFTTHKWVMSRVRKQLVKDYIRSSCGWVTSQIINRLKKTALPQHVDESRHTSWKDWKRLHYLIMWMSHVTNHEKTVKDCIMWTCGWVTSQIMTRLKKTALPQHVDESRHKS